MMDETETLEELEADLRRCTSRVLIQDCVMDLVGQYQNLRLKYGPEWEDLLYDKVYAKIVEVLDQ